MENVFLHIQHSQLYLRMLALHYGSISLKEYYNCSLLDSFYLVFIYNAGKSISATTTQKGAPPKNQKGTHPVPLGQSSYLYFPIIMIITFFATALRQSLLFSFDPNILLHDATKAIILILGEQCRILRTVSCLHSRSVSRLLIHFIKKIMDLNLIQQCALRNSQVINTYSLLSSSVSRDSNLNTQYREFIFPN